MNTARRLFDRVRRRVTRTRAVIPVKPRPLHAWVLDMMDEDMRPVYTRYTTTWRAGASIAEYLDDLQIDPDKLLFVSYRGERIRPDETIDVVVPEPFWIRGLRKLFCGGPLTDTFRRIDVETPTADDVLFIVPALEGKNLSLILGVVGAVIGWIAFPGNPYSFAALQWALAGFAIGSYIGTLLTPRPSIGKGDKSLTTYGWQGVQNEYRTGTPIPIACGHVKNAPVRVGMFIRREFGKERLYMLFLLSIGPISAVTDVKINNQPYTNFDNVTVEVRLGVPGQTYLNGFSSSPTTNPMSVELTTSPFTYTTVSAVDTIEVLITIPQLFHLDSKGNMVNNQTRFKAEWRAVGSSGSWNGFALFNPMALNAATRSTEYLTPRVEGLTLQHYDVRLTWLSADFTDVTKDGWKVYCTGVTEEVQSNTPTYDFGDHQYAMLALRAIATDKLSGGTPLVTCVTDGILCETYNGSALVAASFTRYPAWIALYLFRNTAVGAGNWIESLDELDLQSFKDWADFNAESVTVTPSVGAPFNEARHYFDCVINQQRPFLDVLMDLCATARATPVMVGDKWRIIIDRASPVRQTFAGPGNIVEKSLTIAYRSDSKKVNTFDVSIMDEQNDWNVEPFRVKSQILVVGGGDPVKPEPLTLWGVTRKSQAFRETTYRLNGIAVIRRMAQFLAFTDAILIEVGDVIGITHDMPQWGFPGRAKDGGSTTSIKLDRPVVIAPATSYEVLIRFQNGSNGAGTVCSVTNAPGTTDLLTFTPALATAPARDDIYAFGPLALSTKPYRVISITRSGGGMRKIIATEYFATIFDDSGIVTVINYSQLPNFYAPPPALSTLVLTELTEERTDLSRPSTLLISWDRPLPQAGKGVFEGARIDRSWDGITFQDFLGFQVGTEAHWQNAPQNVPIWIRATPRSTKKVFNDAGAKITGPITLQGWKQAPDDVIGFTPSAKDGRMFFTWQVATRAIQYEARTTDTNWGVDTAFIYRDHGHRFEIVAFARTVSIFIRAVDQFGNYSLHTTTMTCTDVAPGAPTPLTGSIVRTTELIKIPITPPSDTDVLALHLHASTVNGFVPLASNRVASVVGPKGGDFIFRPPAGSTATWYFLATAEDPLSERFDDWVYSSQFSSSLIVIVPQNPFGVTFAENATVQKRRAANVPTSGPPTLAKVFSLFVNWSFSDSVNPTGSLIGFQIVLYPSGGSPAAPYGEPKQVLDPAARSVGIEGLTFEASATYIAAVQALYIDGYASSYATSSGLLLNPATTEDVLAQLKQDPNGGYYLERNVRLTASDGTIITIEKNGITVTNADGTTTTPKKSLHALLRGASGGQFVSFYSATLEPNFVGLSESPPATNKVHIVTQMRQGSTVDLSPVNYPVRLNCNAAEISSGGFRLALSQQEGGTMNIFREDAPAGAGWSPVAERSSRMIEHPNPTSADAHANNGDAAWWNPIAANSSWIVVRDKLWVAADMPSVFKKDGSPYYVDLSFTWARDGFNLVWNGSTSSIAGSSTVNLWAGPTLRAFTDGKRHRVPLETVHVSGIPNSYMIWCDLVTGEPGADPLINMSLCYPIRIVLDAGESHGATGGTTTWRGSLGPEDIDILLVQDH